MHVMGAYLIKFEIMKCYFTLFYYYLSSDAWAWVLHWLIGIIVLPEDNWRHIVHCTLFQVEPELVTHAVVHRLVDGDYIDDLFKITFLRYDLTDTAGVPEK